MCKLELIKALRWKFNFVGLAELEKIAQKDLISLETEYSE